MASESDYGSQYRQFPPISSNLKVTAGVNKPARTKPKSEVTRRAGLDTIKRNPQKPGNK